MFQYFDILRKSISPDRAESRGAYNDQLFSETFSQWKGEKSQIEVNLDEFEYEEAVVPEIVHLNVGGKVFTTTKTTLVASSYFDSMFSGNLSPGARDKDKNIFIDRSPEKFYWVLEWLRCGPQELPPGVSQKDIHDELVYFGINVPDEVCEPASKKQKMESFDVWRAEPGYERLLASVRRWKEFQNPEDSRVGRWTFHFERISEHHIDDEGEQIALPASSFSSFHRCVARKKIISDGDYEWVANSIAVKKLGQALYEDAGVESVEVSDDLMWSDRIIITARVP